MSIFYGLNTAFRHYTGSPVEAMKMKHINRPQSNNRVFHLYSLANKLLPFQFCIPFEYNIITANTFLLDKWRIVKSTVKDPFNVSLPSGDYIDVLDEINTASLNINDFIKITSVIDKGAYVLGFLKNVTFPFDIPEGDWCSVVQMKDGIAAVSEDFHVPCNASTFLTSNDILKIEWSNTKDAFDMLYQFNNPLSKFINRLYLHADLVENTPTIIEEGVSNDKGTFIPQSTTYIDNYTIDDYLPEYIYRALLLARGHDTITVVARGNLISGIMKLRECSIQWGDSGIDGLVKLSLECETLKKHKYICDSNYKLGSPIPVVANDDIVYLYPLNGTVPGFNVLTNDTGVAIYASPLVGIATSGNTIVANLNNNGTITITSFNRSFGFGPPPQLSVTYYIIDMFGNGSSASLEIWAIDWIPTPDVFEIPRLFVTWGARVFDSRNAGYSLLMNDSYPINANNVTCIPGWYFSLVPGTGNYVVVDANGFFTYYITNPVINDRFLIGYFNADANNTKQAFLYVNLY